MAHAHAMPEVPRAVLLAAGALVGVTLVLTAASRLSRSSEGLSEPVAAERVEVRFEDRGDGSVAMLDPVSGREVVRVPPASNGFIRGVLRGLFRERKLESLGRGGTFRIERAADGRLHLEDMATHRRIDLGAFGPDNSAAFGRLFDAAWKERTR